MALRWQRFAAAVAARAPAPLGGLGALRGAAVEAVSEERAAEIERVRGRAAAGLAACDGAADEPFEGADALAGLADTLVGEVRARAASAAASAGLLPRAAAALDAWLPTDAVEWMDRPDLAEPRRARLVAALHAWNVRFGNYARFAEVVAPLLREGDTVLDLAAGHGGWARSLPALVPAPRFRVIASDREPAALDAAAGEGPVGWRVLDARRLARVVRPGEVDVITCTSALHHFGVGGAAVVLAQALARARAVAFVDLARSASRLVAGAAIARVAERDGALAHDTVVSFRRALAVEELRLLARLVPGGERLETAWLAPGFVVARTRVLPVGGV